MRTLKAILFLILILLAAVGLFFMSVTWFVWPRAARRNLDIAGREFEVLPFHTNGVSGVGIVEAKTGEPLWIEWDYGGDSKEFSYFYNGTNVFNLSDFKGKPLFYSVGFHGPGKSSVWWWDIGRGTFIERNFFGTNGDFSKLEVWYNGAWRTGVKQNGRMGIVISGRWHQLSLPTNAMWTIEKSTDAP